MLEAEITGGLEHPGIVPVYGLGTYDDGRPFYAMRFVRGTPQGGDRVVPPGALPVATRAPSNFASYWAGSWTSARRSNYAHSRGVLHRDIKPGNIMVGRYGETLVVDWGLAKATGQSEPRSRRARLEAQLRERECRDARPAVALGTPSYMSPEQAEGDVENLGPRSDVYSLGATLYCLLTGQPPLTGRGWRDVRAVQTGRVSAPPPQLDPRSDPALEAVCLKAMALEPEDRYSSCRGTRRRTSSVGWPMSR